MNLLDYCLTDRQREVVEALESGMSHGSVAAKIGVTRQRVGYIINKVRERAAKAGYCPETGMTGGTPGFKTKRLSRFIDPASGTVRYWHIEEPERQMIEERLQEMFDCMRADLPRYDPIHGPDTTLPLLSVIPFGDPHFGMLSWAKETGDDFDLEIARRDLCQAVAYHVNQAPPCENCLIANLGDFFHTDNYAGTTAKSGNVLDRDSRLPKMFEYGFQALRTCIETALAKHGHVTLINAAGNHDESLSRALSIGLAAVYENEPRITVRTEPTWRHYYHWRKVLIGVVHGDKTKDSNLIPLMAQEEPSAWNASSYRIVYRGHYHQDRLQEYIGGFVRQCATMAAADSYAVSLGFVSSRSMHCYIYNEFGECGSQTLNIDMLRSIQKK